MEIEEPPALQALPPDAPGSDDGVAAAPLSYHDDADAKRRQFTERIALLEDLVVELRRAVVSAERDLEFAQNRHIRDSSQLAGQVSEIERLRRELLDAQRESEAKIAALGMRESEIRDLRRFTSELMQGIPRLSNERRVDLHLPSTELIGSNEESPHDQAQSATRPLDSSDTNEPDERDQGHELDGVRTALAWLSARLIEERASAGRLAESIAGLVHDLDYRTTFLQQLQAAADDSRQLNSKLLIELSRVAEASACCVEVAELRSHLESEQLRASEVASELDDTLIELWTAQEEGVRARELRSQLELELQQQTDRLEVLAGSQNRSEYLLDTVLVQAGSALSRTDELFRVMVSIQGVLGLESTDTLERDPLDLPQLLISNSGRLVKRSEEATRRFNILVEEAAALAASRDELLAEIAPLVASRDELADAVTKLRLGRDEVLAALSEVTSSWSFRLGHLLLQPIRAPRKFMHSLKAGAK